MVKSGLEKLFLKSMHAKSLFRKIFLVHRKVGFCQNCKFSNKNDIFSAWRDFNIFFVMYVHVINETLSHKLHPYSILSTYWMKYESVA